MIVWEVTEVTTCGNTERTTDIEKFRDAVDAFVYADMMRRQRKDVKHLRYDINALAPWDGA